jgi:hypothetical protein
VIGPDRYSKPASFDPGPHILTTRSQISTVELHWRTCGDKVIGSDRDSKPGSVDPRPHVLTTHRPWLYTQPSSTGEHVEIK